MTTHAFNCFTRAKQTGKNRLLVIGALPSELISEAERGSVGGSKSWLLCANQTVCLLPLGSPLSRRECLGKWLILLLSGDSGGVLCPLGWRRRPTHLWSGVRPLKGGHEDRWSERHFPWGLPRAASEHRACVWPSQSRSPGPPLHEPSAALLEGVHICSAPV